MQLELCKEFRFEASHILPKHPGKCSRLHGHSWVLRVYVKGEVDKETGFVMDYANIKQAVEPIIDSLDHQHLGTWGFSHCVISRCPIYCRDYDPFYDHNFYPSSENLIVWIGKQIRNQLLLWSRLELDETCTSSCILTREDYEREIRRG